MAFSIAVSSVPGVWSEQSTLIVIFIIVKLGPDEGLFVLKR